MATPLSKICCFKCNISEEEHIKLVGESLHLDHHIPLTNGGQLKLGNVVLLCKNCNSSKWKHKPEKFYSLGELEKLKDYGIF